MSTLELKKTIADDIRKNMSPGAVDLMLGDQSSSGLFQVLWRVLRESTSCIDKAYYRGYEAGKKAEKLGGN